MTDLLIRGADLMGRGRSDLLIRNGRFVDPADAGADLGQLDADGLIALPGLVDLHTHLREPGREDAETVESGTLAGLRPTTFQRLGPTLFIPISVEWQFWQMC